MSDNIKGEGFKIRDKRHFSPDGDVRDSNDEPVSSASEDTQDSDTATAAQEEKTPPPLPEVNFSSFVLSLSSSALFHFGSIPDPVSQKKQRNLPLAKQTIDILGLLQDKTKGNLSNDEASLLENLLYDLRIRYVEECKKEDQPEKQEEK